LIGLALEAIRPIGLRRPELACGVTKRVGQLTARFG
jgi:hypothetical protein